MSSLRWMAVCVALASVVAQGQPAPVTTPATRPVDLENITNRLTLSPSAAVRGAAAGYVLMPELIDQAPGNAATLYLLARAFWPDQQKTDELLYPEKHRFDYLETPIDQFPRAYGEALLAGYAKTLAYVDAGARRREAVWDTGWRDPALRADPAALHRYLNELRHANNLLGFRARFAAARGDWDAAAYSLQTSFAMARHVAAEPTLVQGLVASGFVQVVVDRGMEEWVARGASPNLYWALTDLPQPFVDLRPVAQMAAVELRAWRPLVSRAVRGELAAGEWPAVIREMVETYRERRRSRGEVGGTVEDDVKKLVESAYPRAKASLVAGGMAEGDVAKLSAEQIVGTYLCREYREAMAEAWRGWALPFWESERQMLGAWRALGTDRPPLSENPLVQAELVADGPPGRPVSQMLMARYQIARADQSVNLVRTIEAIRDYAAGHDGRLPARLEDITDLPLPIDPVTGRPFAYTVEGGAAILYSPAPTWRGFLSARRYVLTMGK